MQTAYDSIPHEDGLRTETFSGSNHEEKEYCCVDGIIMKLITLYLTLFSKWWMKVAEM
jgi:hypothetical protein